jgi:hypothetical protein
VRVTSRIFPPEGKVSALFRKFSTSSKGEYKWYTKEKLGLLMYHTRHALARVSREEFVPFSGYIVGEGGERVSVSFSVTQHNLLVARSSEV